MAVNTEANTYAARKMFDNGYVRAYHLRGLAYKQLGEFARAFQYFDRALEIDPEYGAAYHSRETMLSNTKRPEPAFEDFEMVNHLTAMRLKHFDEKVRSDLAI